MAIPIYQVDAFTDRPFAGNPAAVCLLPAPADEAWMQAVAREMNLSETAFLCRATDGYRLRWFTPAVEVDLCGHATLASAHALWETGSLQPQEHGAVPHPQRPADRGAPGELDRDWTSRPRRTSRSTLRRVWLRRWACVPLLCGPEPLRLLWWRSSRRRWCARCGPTSPRLRRAAGARGDRHQPGRHSPGSISSRASLPPARASTRTRSPAPPTAAWGLFGSSAWARSSSSPTRPRRVAGRCMCAWMGNACAWAARRSPCCVASWWAGRPSLRPSQRPSAFVPQDRPARGRGASVAACPRPGGARGAGTASPFPHLTIRDAHRILV